MRVTILHSEYRSASVSGENLAVIEQAEALRDAGLTVMMYTRSSDVSAQHPFHSLSAAFRVASGLETRTRDLPQARDSGDVLLVHNLFPNFGVRWVRSWQGPIVVMLHNYRYLCANGLLLRAGETCTLCVSGSTLSAIKYGCYRDSALATLPIAIGNRGPVQMRSPIREASLVLAQSSRAAAIYESAGVPKERLRVLPGFTRFAEYQPCLDPPADPRWVFVGRLSEEKGIRPLIESWPAGVGRLDVIGDGPQLGELGDHPNARVKLLGGRPHDQVVEMLRGYTGLVFPGVCLEGAHPRVVREALANGVPVVAASGSSAADVVEATGAGRTYDPRDPAALHRSLIEVSEQGRQLRVQAYESARVNFGRERWQLDMTSLLLEAVSIGRRKVS